MIRSKEYNLLKLRTMKNLKSIVLATILSGSAFISFAQEKEVKTPEERLELSKIMKL